MTSLKGAYYVEEVKSWIASILEFDSVDSFYKNQVHCLFENGPYIQAEGVNPLLKVAWNLLNRGDATRASLRLSAYLLNKHFPGSGKPIPDKPEIRLEWALKEEIPPAILEEILNNFSTLTAEQVCEMGSAAYGLFGLLKDGIRFAQLHKAMLLAMMANSSPISFAIEGLAEAEAVHLQEDLNDLFTALNQLVHGSEAKIPFLLQKDAQQIRILLEAGDDSCMRLRPVEEEEPDPLGFCVLTDRRIRYKELGKVVVTEKEGGETSEVHTFEFHKPALKASFRYFLQNFFRKADFKPGQLAIINRAIQGKDVIGLLPTGGGKSLTFQLCALLQPGITVVVDPINSLMKDQFDKLIDNGITRASFINSFNTKDERSERMQALAEGQYQILFVSPERFQMENFRQSLSACRDTGVYFSYAVIDEAHCVSEWGHDFRHVYLNLAQNLKRFCHPKTGPLTIFGLTATASFDVLADVQRELDLKEDAIASLPAEAIDRKELNFSILPIHASIEPGLRHFAREFQMEDSKYPVIKQLLKEMPAKIAALEKSYGYPSESKNFFGRTNGKYKNAGVVFCPTKSIKLPNGVLHLAYGKDKQGGGLSELSFLELRTFFGSEGDDVVQTELIGEAARESFKNQDEFIKNDANLMIATKAFGMGIDKPNIRYSIHYTFPSSVESFYQEAGRAGRDGFPSLCSILYHPLDLEANMGFFQNGFKGMGREKNIIDELLEEIQYEDGFFLNLLAREIKDEFSEVKSVKLKSDRYVDIYGRWDDDRTKKVDIGRLDLDRNLKTYDNTTQNIELQKANKILEFTRKKLREYCPEGNYLKWFKTKSADGIKTLIETGSKDRYLLQIPFTNGIVSQMNEIIQKAGYKDFEEQIIRAAYDFSPDHFEFLNSLQYQYKKFQINNKKDDIQKFNPGSDVEEILGELFYKIRNSQDTQRAIYRLNILGIIDDYVIDYIGKIIEVRFKAKTDAEYYKNFENYLRRYLGIQKTEEWVQKAIRLPGDSALIKVLYTMMEFVDGEIADKRQKAIEYMRDLCEVHISEGEREFRDRMIRYFTSKYARVDYLPADTERGKKENCAIVKKYIEFIDHPPDGLGGQIDNAKHLRGACDNLRINMKENASVDLLTSFSLLALELKQEDTLDSANEKPLVKKAKELYRTGFRRMLRIDPWEEVKDLMIQFNKKTLDFNSEIKPTLDELAAEILVNRTHFKLKQLLDKIAN